MRHLLPIPSAPGYSATADGHILSAKRGALRQLREGKCGAYASVSIYGPEGQRPGLVHRLVCEAFHGPPPTRHEVRHLDGDPLNNAESNLAWGTRRENHADKWRHGTQQTGSRNPNSVLDDQKVEEILRRAAGGEYQTVIASAFGISPAHVSLIVLGRIWEHIPRPSMEKRVTNCGENHSSAKLTEDDVRDIRRWAAEGQKRREIATRFGITVANVSQIVRHRTWAHVDGGGHV